MNRTLLSVVAVLVAVLVVSRLARSGADRPDARRGPAAARRTVTGRAGGGDPLAAARASSPKTPDKHTSIRCSTARFAAAPAAGSRRPGVPGRHHRGRLPDYDPRLADFVREAVSRWESAGLGYWYCGRSDTTEADITFGWRRTFGLRNQAGQTDLSWDRAGNVLHASVVLATRTGEDSLFTDEALLDAAIHEVGHAMGMPHSTDSADVMFPTTRTGVLTERDLATARLLYSLPPGSLKGPPR
jgi:hypothetical protein